MNRTKIVLLAAVLSVALGATLFGGVLREGGATAAAPPPVALDRLPGALAASDTAGLTAQLQADARATPSAKNLTYLGLAYQQRARETSDPSFYAPSERALRRALKLEPDNTLALTGLGALALTRHRFAEALVLGRRARALASESAAPYGVIGDALVELGRYDEAFRAFDRMAALKPTTASYARVSYARQLIGDGDGAVEAMELARDAAVGRPEALAWAHVQLAEMHLSSDLDRAFAETEDALRAFAGYPPAYETRAHVYAARGDLQTAVRLQRRAVSAFPTPHFYEALGDMERVRGNDRAARQAYARVRELEDRFAAAGTRIAIERAKFDVDHGFRLGEALVLARQGHREHPSIEGDDTLAWALARNGRCEEALRWSKRSMRLGVNDAEFAFHRGMIERCLGRHAEARSWFRRALGLDPNFSHLWAPVAKRLARQDV